MAYPVRPKVLAYITRQRGGGLELLVFDHVGIPEAGTQVPAGTVEPGEPPGQAALREAFEETGVSDLAVDRFAGRFEWYCEPRQELHERHVFKLRLAVPLPDTWIHTVSAGAEDKGLQFRCYWIDAAFAADRLAGDQGAYLRHVLAVSKELGRLADE